MLYKILGKAAVLASAMSVATSALGQAQTIETAVTFNVPVNLTQLDADVERVRVVCGVQSDALTIPPIVANAWSNSPAMLPGDEATVLFGKVQKTMQVIFPIHTGWLNDPIGKPARYFCGLLGFSRSQQRWQGFGPGAFNVSPPVQSLEGQFTW